MKPLFLALLAASSAMGQLYQLPASNLFESNAVDVAMFTAAVDETADKSYVWAAYPPRGEIITNVFGEVWSNYVAPYSYKGTNYTNVLEGHLIGERHITNGLSHWPHSVPIHADNIPPVTVQWQYDGQRSDHWLLQGEKELGYRSDGSVIWRVPPESKEK